MLLQSAGPFSICYLFRGQTYFAKQKLENFVETIQKEPKLWQTLEKFEKSSQVAELRELPEMESLLSNIFLS
jgi:chromosome segregation and condensation protein ScpB